MREPLDLRTCPFLNTNLPQCAERFTLERMTEVFHYCLGEHRQCAMYHELTVQGERIGLPSFAQAG